MDAIDMIYAIKRGFTAPTPYTGTNYRKRVGRSERVKGGNLNVRKRSIKAEGR